eukprot:symbB.v1.2.037807.t1/scaffold5688.1/size24575/1
MYCSKDDWREKGAGAPRIFFQGAELSLEEAVTRFVTDELLQEFKAIRRAEEQGLSESRPRPGRGHAHQDFQDNVQVIYVEGPLDVSQIPARGNVIFML